MCLLYREAQNLWRMKQMYETYKDYEKLSPVVRELPWTHNAIILHNLDIAKCDIKIESAKLAP
ncbi:MAG: hypothetical protein KKG01_03400 [Candidatus Omnitrophica bacterium]|nr:hypothetical protein [Candidatus Omnitrophota bacterium]